MKRHPNGLAARISAKLGEAAVDELIAQIAYGHLTYEEAAGDLHERGLDTSKSAVARFYSSESCRWRLDRAREAAEATEDSLPTDWEDRLKRGLAQKTFELAFSDLTVLDLVRLRRTELLQARTDLDARKVTLLEKKFADATKTLSDGSLSAEERVEKMKRIMRVEG